MAYEKQNFVDGNVLTADNLNHMEEGIAAAAPAGFGLGSEFGKACSDCDLALENGYYQIGASTEHRPDGMSTRCWMQVISYGSTYKTQICYSSAKAIKIREMNDGTWTEWVDISPSAFAPAGYGLGEANGKVVSTPNDAINNGFYNVKNDNYTGDGTTVNWRLGWTSLLVERRGDAIAQTAKYGDVIWYRSSPDGGATWNPWEWVNPPMELGVEYRTTKRYNGKAVYTKAIEHAVSTKIGTGSGWEHYTISNCFGTITRPVSCYAYTVTTTDFYANWPYIGGSGGLVSACKLYTYGAVVVHLFNGSIAAGEIIVIVAEYTKD